jgi:Rhs element Vgr protein
MPKTMRVMEIATPLGEDVLLFHGMHAHEEMGRLGEFQLDLLSPKKDINVDGILGKHVTVKLALPDDSTRFFNGFVTRFAQGAQYGRYYRYFATVHSWLWFLTRTTDCRIFQEMSVPDIVKKVFTDHPHADFKFELTGSYRKWNYCVQYRETDFNFVSRLLEEEGIYYYVRHTDGHDTVVFTDSTSKHTTRHGYEKLSFVSPEQVIRPELERITAWDFSREIQPGVYVHDDYDLERPSVELKTRKVLPRSYASSDYEIYDYPGHYIQKPDGEQYAAVRIDEFGSQFETAQAVTNAKGIAVGSLFTLEDAPRADQNREHLILAASYDLEFSDYEALPDGAARSSGAASSRCRARSSSGEAGDAEAVHVQGRRPQSSSGRPATDLHGQMRPREGAVPLGSLRQEGSEQLVLDSRLVAVGRQGLGRRVDAAHRAGSHRRLPRRRSRSADHHRPGLQRGEPAAVRLPGRRGAERHQVEHAQGHRVQRTVHGRHRREGTRLHSRPVQHGHGRRARPDIHDPQQPHRQGRHR